MSYLAFAPHEVGCMLQEHVSRLLDVNSWGKEEASTVFRLLSHLSRKSLLACYRSTCLHRWT